MAPVRVTFARLRALCGSKCRVPNRSGRRGASRGRSNHWRREAGFTLLELLVALTLLALIVALLFGGMRFGTRAWEAANERIDRSSELQVVQSFIRSQLGQAHPVALSGDRSKIAFQGTPEGVTFAAPMPAHLSLGGFYLLSFHAEDGAKGRRLVLSWRLFDPKDEELASGEPEETTVLIDRISEVEFSYFGSSDPEDEPEWRDRWEGEESLPSLVRLRVAFAEGDERSWPDLVIAPVIE